MLNICEQFKDLKWTLLGEGGDDVWPNFCVITHTSSSTIMDWPKFRAYKF